MTNTKLKRTVISVLLEARLMRRIKETVIANVEAEILCPRKATAGLLKKETINLADECNPDKLKMKDFKKQDFDKARILIADIGIGAVEESNA